MNDWIKVGTSVRCEHQIDLEGLSILQGTEAEIIDSENFGEVKVEVEVFGQSGWLNQLEGDFRYYWKPIGIIPAAKERAKVSMFLDVVPDIPGRDMGGKKMLGYWASSSDPDACQYSRKNMTLPWPADFVDETWDENERAQVVAYLKNGEDFEHWKGLSFCRLGCGTISGATCQTDGTYVWPEGFAHYVEKHGVKPPQEFIDEI